MDEIIVVMISTDNPKKGGIKSKCKFGNMMEYFSSTVRAIVFQFGIQLTSGSIAEQYAPNTTPANFRVRYYSKIRYKWEIFPSSSPRF